MVRLADREQESARNPYSPANADLSKRGNHAREGNQRFIKAAVAAFILASLIISAVVVFIGFASLSPFGIFF